MPQVATRMGILAHREETPLDLRVVYRGARETKSVVVDAATAHSIGYGGHLAIMGFAVTRVAEGIGTKMVT